MLELLNTPGHETVSKPSEYVLRWIDTKLEQKGEVRFAELGVGIGATTVKVAERLGNRGEIHIFDFNYRVKELRHDLRSLGFNNIFTHPNSEKHWDSYHWNLSKLLRDGKQESFDVIYLDGAHTYLHDALAFFMCDRLLKVGGIFIFDDWYWAFANSSWMKDTRHEFMTEEQAASLQIKMFLEELVNTHVGYEELERLTVYRKIANTTKSERLHLGPPDTTAPANKEGGGDQEDGGAG